MNDAVRVKVKRMKVKFFRYCNMEGVLDVYFRGCWFAWECWALRPAVLQT